MQIGIGKKYLEENKCQGCMCDVYCILMCATRSKFNVKAYPGVYFMVKWPSKQESERKNYRFKCLAEHNWGFLKRDPF